jgi:hypothetical protein
MRPDLTVVILELLWWLAIGPLLLIGLMISRVRGGVATADRDMRPHVVKNLTK